MRQGAVDRPLLEKGSVSAVEDCRESWLPEDIPCLRYEVVVIRLGIADGRACHPFAKADEMDTMSIQRGRGPGRVQILASKYLPPFGFGPLVSEKLILEPYRKHQPTE